MPGIFRRVHENGVVGPFLLMKGQLKHLHFCSAVFFTGNSTRNRNRWMSSHLFVCFQISRTKGLDILILRPMRRVQGETGRTNCTQCEKACPTLCSWSFVSFLPLEPCQMVCAFCTLAVFMIEGFDEQRENSFFSFERLLLCARPKVIIK